MKENIIFILGKYIRKHRRSIIAHILIILIFIVVFYLSNLPVDAVVYGTFLSFVAVFLFLLYDFFRFYKRHKILSELTHKITVSLEELPKAGDLLESDYHNLIRLLYHHGYSLASEADNKYQEMVDYYTLWAHQIKTPISAMWILLQAEDTPGNARLSQELFKIERYVEMVLQYLRLESLSSDLVLQSYDLSAMVRKAAKKYAAMFIYNKIKLEIKEINCYVLTDEKWFVFVLEQLISNALKYTAAGTISIYIDENAPMTLVIEDTGMGIQKEDIPRIFEKGFTGYNGRMDKKSTGLGLYLCSRILKRLSHKISITSSVGEGTKVFIDLSRENDLLRKASLQECKVNERNVSRS